MNVEILEFRTKNPLYVPKQEAKEILTDIFTISTRYPEPTDLTLILTDHHKDDYYFSTTIEELRYLINDPQVKIDLKNSNFILIKIKYLNSSEDSVKIIWQNKD